VLTFNKQLANNNSSISTNLGWLVTQLVQMKEHTKKIDVEMLPVTADTGSR